jgi:ubiquinone/menaquinone biosynthesis C-methylase UbiE
VLRAFVASLAAWPSAFDLLRYLLEGGYRGHRSVWVNELSLRTGLIADIGCGTGIHAMQFTADAYVGVDLSVDYVTAAARKYPAYQFMAADAMQLPFKARAFHTIMISGMLHHLSDDQVNRVLSEAERVLEHDGTLIVWEDIPSPSAWNVVGHIIHRLDIGRFIRRPDAYRTLLEFHFDVQSTRIFRSGFMDYAVFACRRRKRSDA